MLGRATLSPRPRPIVFKRWSRRPYAAFCSLHREVVIGVVKASIADAQMLKMGRKTRTRQCPTPRTDKTADDGYDPPPDTLATTATPTPTSDTDTPARTAHRRTGRGGMTTEDDNNEPRTGLRQDEANRRGVRASQHILTLNHPDTETNQDT